MTLPAGPLFHGGIPRLHPGDVLRGGHVRPVIDGCAICAARSAGMVAVIAGQPVDPPSSHPDRLYVTTSRPYARFYASLFGAGDVYEVEPLEPLHPSDEDHFPSWLTTSARIKRVTDVAVTLSPKERRHLYRIWSKLDALHE